MRNKKGYKTTNESSIPRFNKNDSNLSQSLLSVHSITDHWTNLISFFFDCDLTLSLAEPDERGNDDESLRLHEPSKSPKLHRSSPRSPGRSRSTVNCHVGVLPALSVMNKLHQQPYDGSRVYNVEIMGYDECFENLVCCSIHF